jgi:antitoxin component YwqK of YwqJK toxin-antitoxin module
MKRLLMLLSATFLFSCTKDNVDTAIPDGALQRITQNGQIHASFEYSNGMLSKEKRFGHCETPYQIVQYVYQAGKLIQTETASRSTYASNSSALCDPKGDYEISVVQYSYDAQGRVKSEVLANTSVAYEYNAEDVVKRFFENGQASQRVHYLKFDTAGNLLEEKTPDPVNGGIVRYVYDNLKNPLAGTGAYPSAFNGPNNVTKSFDANGKQLLNRKLTYNAAGLPIQCDEGNGIVLAYHYQ